MWVWIENPDSHVILYSEEFQMQYKKRFEEQRLEFAIPVFPPFPEYYTLRVSSDHWLGADVVTYLPLRGCACRAMASSRPRYWTWTRCP